MTSPSHRWPPARPDRTAFVIADIGKNFIETPEDRTVDEYLENALGLIDAAADAGVDAIKFQTHVAEDEQRPLFIKAPHFDGADRHSWVTRNTLATPPRFWEAVKARVESHGKLFLSTPMSCKAAKVLEGIGMPFWKVASGDVGDFVLLDFLKTTGKPILLSSGMTSRMELRHTIDFLGGCQLGILYCISKYPCPPGDFNLTTIHELQGEYPQAVIGFSDHSLGSEAALAAVSMGATIVEKHFSHSRELWGPDHKVSMTPAEMKGLVADIRSGAEKNIDPAPFLGSPNQELEGANNAFRPSFHKCLVAATDLPAGTTLKEGTLYAMRPAMGGITSRAYMDVLGKKTTKALKKYDPLTPDCL